MASVGLFTREDLNQVQVRRVDQTVGDQRLRELGPKAVRGMNKDAITPEMPPDGVKRPLVYVLGEAPSEDEDKDGRLLVGRAGKFLCNRFPVGYQKLIRINNCVGTRPPASRTPTRTEIECFRTSVEEDIERSKPKVILGLGPTPLQWVLGHGAAKMTGARGRWFPIKIRSHTCWFVPTFQPAYMGRLSNSRELVERVPAEDWVQAWEMDIRNVFDRARDKREPEVVDPEGVNEGVEIAKGLPGEYKSVLRFMEWVRQTGKTFAIDLETNALRPYVKRAKILTVAIACGDRCVAFALDHRQSSFDDQQRDGLRSALRVLLASDNARVAHNAPFEIEWLLYLLGVDTIRNDLWECSQAQAYILDEWVGLSLDFLCRLHFGLRLKEISNLDRAKLDDADLGEVLTYNGLDAKYGLKLYYRQKKLIKSRGLKRSYRLQRQRIPAFAFAQVQGLRRDARQIKLLRDRMLSKEMRIRAAIAETKPVQKFVRNNGSFNATSTKDLITLLRDQLGRDEGALPLGRYNTDESVLKQMDDLPLAKLILDLRGVRKMRSTYLDPLHVGSKNCVIWPDDLIHAIFKLTWTDSGRCSCEYPSLQNFPKRTDAWVRKIITADPDWVLLAFDFGALEARGIAMSSGDKNLIKYLWDDWDIHSHYAKRIIELRPSILDQHGGVFKAVRNAVKNQMVFPAFYLSGEKGIREALELDDHDGHTLFEEFWDDFKGVKHWQRELLQSYADNGYVEGLTGRRRRGPISRSMIVNSPIQGFCSDIVMDAMVRLFRKALDTDRPWLAPVINIHDDLTFHLPRKKVDEAMEEIVPIMCRPRFDFINVPILIEGFMGTNWYEMQDIGKFQSNKLDRKYAQNN